jgi:proteasome lid subunit RPN8/RPN11
MKTRIPKSIKIPAVLKSRILEQALSRPVEEVCGLAGGTGNLVKTIYPVTNIATDTKHQFLMAPEEQFEIMRSMRESGEEMIGIYHSHPESLAEPSATDIEMAAYPDVFYFIISLRVKQPELVCYYYDGLKFFRIETDII